MFYVVDRLQNRANIVATPLSSSTINTRAFGLDGSRGVEAALELGALLEEELGTRESLVSSGRVEERALWSSTVARVPTAMGVSQILPPKDSTMRRQMGKPRPVPMPRGFVVKKDRKPVPGFALPSLHPCR